MSLSFSHIIVLRRSLSIGTTMIVLLLTMASCRPREVLSPSQMREVIYDLHRTEAIFQVAGYTYGHDEKVGKYYFVILDKHGVTQAQFDSSLVWYTDHPQRFNKIYPLILKRCETELAAWDMKHPSQMQIKPRAVREMPPLDDVKNRLWHGLNNGWTVPRLPDVEVQVPFECDKM